MHVEQYSKARRTLDTELLSSPLLHSLKISVLSEDYVWYHPSYSEFPRLSEIIAKSKSLRVLRMDQQWSENGWYNKDESAFGPFRLQFPNDDAFPALEDLQLCALRYMANEAHMQRWLRVMDWSRLRSLDLGRHPPGRLLRALTGNVPQLQKLAMGFWEDDFSGNWKSDHDTVRAFVNSVHSLEVLLWRNHSDLKFWPAIRPSLLSKHGRSLRSLTVTWEGLLQPAWELDQLEDLLARAPDLEELSTLLDVPKDRTSGSLTHDWVRM